MDSFAVALDKRGGFHAHLNTCKQCSNHPFDTCLTGRLLLLAAASVRPLGNINEENAMGLEETDVTTHDDTAAPNSSGTPGEQAEPINGDNTGQAEAEGHPTHNGEPINLDNTHGVVRHDDDTVLIRGPVPRKMSVADAIVLAAHIVDQVGSFDLTRRVFQHIVK